MIVAVDTGGTKTLIASFDHNGHVIQSVRFPTPHNHNEYLETLKQTLANHFDTARIQALIVALPGRIDDTQTLVLARNLDWRNFDLRSALAEIYTCPIYIENDANLAGLAASQQLLPSVRTCLYVTISTGIGTGLIVHGMIDEDFRQSEGGQIVLEHNGVMTRWENFASGHAIRETYGRFASEIDDDAAWQSIAKNIAAGFLALLPILRPDAVVIGGSIGTYFERYKDSLSRELHSYLHYVPPFYAAVHPEEAVIYGSYYYARNALRNSQDA